MIRRARAKLADLIWAVVFRAAGRYAARRDARWSERKPPGEGGDDMRKTWEW